ncbi:fasciclin domain-containing protein [Sphingobacterium sp. Mn56C]|uniref:fasciclin domain-containing protein n=1 Tax=Sphingobacterium sp. Mn56C TaxID=3395261 RepID=UPI003BD4B7EB
MKNRKNFIPVFGLLFLAVALFFTACQKTEFMPDPEGEKVPFPDTVKSSLVDIIRATPTLKTFYAAWEKGNIKNLLKEKGDKARFTVFAPSDAAFQSQGITVASIQKMTAANIDSLLLFYVSLGDIKPINLQDRSDNLMVKSLLPKPGVYVKYYEGNVPGTMSYDLYFHRYYMKIQGDELLANGKKTGKLNYIPATDGGLYTLTRTIEKPTKTILEILEANGRFKLFLESQRLTDQLFFETIAPVLEPYIGYIPDDEEMRSAWATYRFYYTTGWKFTKPIYEGFIGQNLTVSTLFAPTDEAFRKVGFNTAEDIVRFNLEHGDARFDEDYFEIKGGYPMDTLYNYHRDFGRFNRPRTPGGDGPSNNATVFFSNDLGPQLNNYLVGLGGNVGPEYAFTMPLEFSFNNGRTQIKIKGSSAPAATVIDADILSLNGPIHVVDNLFVPKGFKFK